METIRLLTLRNQEIFFSDCTVNEVFKYSEAFLLRDVLNLANKHGVIVKYCNPNTPEYSKHGSFTCKVLELPEKKSAAFIYTS